MREINDKIAIITGASSGIGEATAKRLSHFGAKVVLAARTENKLRAIGNQITKSSGECLVIKTDVSIKKDIEKLINKTLDKFGKIDIFISNAGLYIQGNVIDIGENEFQQSFSVNFYPSIYAVEKLIPIMLKNKSGNIVFVNSLDAKKGIVGDAAYVSAKSALSGYGDVLRQELKEFGINVLSVYPGRIDTPMIHNLKVPSISPKYSPDLVAKGIIKGIRRNKAKIVVPMSNALIGLLNELSPRMMDWLYRALRLEGEKL